MKYTISLLLILLPFLAFSQLPPGKEFMRSWDLSGQTASLGSDWGTFDVIHAQYQGHVLEVFGEFNTKTRQWYWEYLTDYSNYASRDTIHVLDSIYFKAISADGSIFPQVIVHDPQATLPLPAGKYFVTVKTKDPDLVEGYLHFVKEDSVLVGNSVGLSGGVTKQALIRIRKDPWSQPPQIFIAESGRGWTMYENNDHYYAYVVENTVVRIYLGEHEFRMQPKAGEIWDLDITMFQIAWDIGDMFGEPTVPEVPIQPLRVEGETHADCLCPPIRPSVTGTPGVGGSAAGSWVRYNAINLTGRKTITFRQSSINTGLEMDIRIGSLLGQLIATYKSTSTGSWETYEAYTIPIAETQGTHDLFFVFRERAVMDYDWFELR